MCIQHNHSPPPVQAENIQQSADISSSTDNSSSNLNSNMASELSSSPSTSAPSTSFAPLLSSVAPVDSVEIGEDKSEDVPVEYLDTLSKDRANRLEYLLKQTEIFAHFLANGQPKVEPKKTKKKKKKVVKKATGKGRRKTTLPALSDTEEEEEEHLAPVADYPTRFDTTPDYIQGVMRDYQLRGLNWMIGLYENGINGILADEMGLGKTLQTISLLGYLKNCRNVNGPHLIVVPKSTLQNWLQEIERFCPSLSAFILIGSKDERKKLVKAKIKPRGRRSWNVLITSYECAVSEKHALGQMNWRYVIIDEGHKIKNEKTILASRLRSYKCTNRLLLTGTPLQNNMHELWSLLNFLLPDVFDSCDDFDNWFDSKEFLQSNSLIQRLHAILKPFLLRRLKVDVETSLLPKIELIVHVGMTKLQNELYKKVLLKDLDIIKNNVPSKAVLNYVLMHLRKCCNHPYLFPGVEPGPPYAVGDHLIFNCGKMIVLDKLLTKLKEQGSRVLIFTQMTRVLDILEDYCYWKKYSYCRLDGNTDHDDRTKFMREYNEENSEKFIFMLSTRAGGLGINLATADVVIIYDSDWNPQADLQAMDRAHRIGQKKQVRVFRLITENSVEQRMLEVALAKLELNSAVIRNGGVVEEETKVGKKGILSAIRTGIDQIFGMKNVDQITDESIEVILDRAKTRTDEFKDKLAKLTQESSSDDLRKLAFDVEEEKVEEESQKLSPQLMEAIQKQYSCYNFEGEDYRLKKKGNEVQILESEDGGRSRRRCTTKKPFYYESNDPLPVKQVQSHNKNGGYQQPKKPIMPKKIKAFKLFDFQFASDRLKKLLLSEYRFYLKSVNHKLLPTPDETPEQAESRLRKQSRIDESRPLTAEELAEKSRLSNECFLHWKRSEYELFMDASMEFGRDAYDKIAATVLSKTRDQVATYAQYYWNNYHVLKDYVHVKRCIEQADQTRLKLAQEKRSDSNHVEIVEEDVPQSDGKKVSDNLLCNSPRKATALSNWDQNLISTFNNPLQQTVAIKRPSPDRHDHRDHAKKLKDML